MNKKYLLISFISLGLLVCNEVVPMKQRPVKRKRRQVIEMEIDKPEFGMEEPEFEGELERVLKVYGPRPRGARRTRRVVRTKRTRTAPKRRVVKRRVVKRKPAPKRRVVRKKKPAPKRRVVKRKPAPKRRVVKRRPATKKIVAKKKKPTLAKRRKTRRRDAKKAAKEEFKQETKAADSLEKIVDKFRKREEEREEEVEEEGEVPARAELSIIQRINALEREYIEEIKNTEPNDVRESLRPETLKVLTLAYKNAMVSYGRTEGREGLNAEGAENLIQNLKADIDSQQRTHNVVQRRFNRQRTLKGEQKLIEVHGPNYIKDKQRELRVRIHAINFMLLRIHALREAFGEAFGLITGKAGPAQRERE